MLILHAGFYKGNFFIWGETGLEPAQPKKTSKSQNSKPMLVPKSFLML